MISGFDLFSVFIYYTDSYSIDFAHKNKLIFRS